MIVNLLGRRTVVMLRSKREPKVWDKRVAIWVFVSE